MTTLSPSEISSYIPDSIQGIIVKPFDSGSYLVQNQSKYFKVSKEVAHLVGSIDGNKSIQDIKENYNNTFNSNFSDQEIFEILTNNIQKLIDKTELTISAPSYLKLSKIIVSEKWLTPISSLCSYLFSSHIVRLNTILLLATIMYAINNWEIIKNDINYDLAKITPYLLAAMLISTIFHEIGHISACKYYGVRHGGIGVGFYLITPVMFADVTSAWELPSNKRVVINFAGLYFEAIFMLSLFIFYILTKESICIAVCVFVLIKSFYNLNPFFRTDGYWVLSDVLNIPNLRKKSNKALLDAYVNRKRMRRYFFDNWFLISYALISVSFLIFFLNYVIFFNIKTIILLPYNIYNLVMVLFNGNKITLLNLSKYIHDVMVPIAFYYFLVTRIVVPLIKKFFSKHLNPNVKPLNR
jgi:putative peptide zinc metalloprotease protein